ncbi:hypothetical protein JXA31_04895 [Candidatus Bathyarchaeota archaeon]|nr:hypothetical protein [Candidatus Bathyarchaeota archaeon]
MKFKSNRLVTGLFLEAIGLCLMLSFIFINIAATATLLIFNLFFLSLIIQLNGTLNIKLGILTLGNITGLFWNVVLHHFAIAGVTFFGEPFNVFYAVSYPFLNFMWVVSFWSMSLAVLPKPKSMKAEVKT